jgi:pimeloyl-ACP methyl ester carboxylesterase
MATRQAALIDRAEIEDPAQRVDGNDSRRRLLEGIPVTERRLELAGIPTAVLEGGKGPPVILLHGPGESAANWRWVLPGLVKTHRAVAPDLPAHGSTEAPGDGLDADRVLAWLGELVKRTCSSPPALVGHVLGGAIAARFASARSGQLSRLVLVDSLGLGRFRPSPRFALGMVGFLARPSERTYQRFMRQCAFDLDGLRERMGDRWEPFVSYNLELARGPNAKVAGRLFRKLGVPRIPPEELARISVPTTLIWGRHDRALRLRMAEAASARYGWSLHVIEESADDPPRDQPEAFLRALHVALGRTITRRQR